jgi:hypothetical protein
MDRPCAVSGFPLSPPKKRKKKTEENRRKTEEEEEQEQEENQLISLNLPGILVLQHVLNHLQCQHRRKRATFTSSLRSRLVGFGLSPASLAFLLLLAGRVISR